MRRRSGALIWLRSRVAAAGGEEGERGVIAILAAIVLTLLVFATAFSVDLSARVMDARQNQAVADLAALDAARGFANGAHPGQATLLGLACASAARNLLTCSGNNLVLTTVGSTGVAVTVTTGAPRFFGGFSGSVARTATAQFTTQNVNQQCTVGSGGCIPPTSTTANAQFSMGSTFAEVNAGLNAFGLAQLGTSADVLGYAGLVNGGVTFQALRDRLNTDLHTSLLTPTDVLNESLTMGQLLNSYATLLQNDGLTNAAASITALRTKLSTSFTAIFNSTITVGQALGISSGNGQTLASTINLLQLFNGALQVANGKNAIALSLGLGNLANVSLAAISPPTISLDGPITTTQATNSQVTISATINIANLNLGAASVSGSLPVTITAGGATGTLQAVDCSGSSNSDIKLSTAFNNANISINGTNTLSATILGLPVSVLSVGGSIAVPGNPPASWATVNNAANFSSTNPQAPITSSSTGLGSVQSNLSVSILDGLLGLNVGTVSSLLLNAINPTAIISAILSNSSIANLGVNIGNAAYLGIQASCPVYSTGNQNIGTTTTVITAPKLTS